LSSTQTTPETFLPNLLAYYNMFLTMLYPFLELKMNLQAQKTQTEYETKKP